MMNDRFKLRFFDAGSKEYLYPDADGWMFIKETQSRVNIHDLLYDDRSEFIPEQCTGLKDKKNQLLYEGDIIKIIATGYFKHHEKISNRQARNILKDDFRYSLGVERIIGFNNKPDSEGMYTCEFTYISKIDVVTMDRFPCCWLKNEEFGYEGEGLINPRDCIKIGNIHENPDLLKSGEVRG